MLDGYQHRSIPQIWLKCSFDWIEMDDSLDIIGIQEDFEGRDVLTFKCPKCKEAHDSLIRIA